MKSSLLVHGCWFAAVVAAFAYGSMRARTTNAADSSPSAQRVTLGSLDIDASGNGESGSQHADGSSKKSNGLTGWTSSRRPLTESDILELGRQFKNPLDPIQRRLAFARLLEGLTVDNALQIREQIAHLDGESAEFREFHYAWGAIGGSDAVLNGTETKERDMAATLAGWASADPAAAMNWFNSLPEKNEKFSAQDLKTGMIHGLANNDPSLAASYVFKFAEGGDGQAEKMLGIVTEKVLQVSEPAEAADWAAGLPDSALRASAMDRVAHDYVAKDPVAAAAWAEQFAGDSKNARVIEEVGDEWAERDPKASIAWLESLDPGEGKSQGIGSALGEWVKKDPEAASQYLIDMPNSQERDYAISGFSSRLAWEDPASAITWADEITDPGKRSETLVQAGQALFRRDAEATRIWLPSSGLSPEAQEKVLNPPRRR
jgi:hypothetical protein